MNTFNTRLKRFTTAETCLILGFRSRTTIWDRVRRGLLEPQYDGNRLFFTEQAITAYLERVGEVSSLISVIRALESRR